MKTFQEAELEELTESYGKQGFIVIEDLLNEAELSALTNDVMSALQSFGKQKIAGDNAANMVEGDEYYDHIYVQRLNLWKINAGIKSFFTSPEMGVLLRGLTGQKGMRIWHDQTLQKMPWSNPTSWHLDDPYWSFYSRDAISIWIALDDATVENGCVHVLPGSHKLANFENSRIGQNMGDLFEVYPEFKELEPVTVEIKAGSASLHNGLTAHAAGPNMTPRWRRAMTCAYMPEGATFNGQKNILSDEYAAGLKVGDLLNDDQQNPPVA